MTAPRSQSARHEPPCVVHLVREANGIEPLRAFLDSYRRHDAGVAHRLVLLFKGFGDRRGSEAHRALANDLDFEEVFVSDDGFDLSAYRRAAAALSADRYCFLNSFSRIQADGWLALLDGALARDGIGVAGASGSWASILSFALFHLGLPSAYRSVFGGRRETLRQFRAIERERAGDADATSERRARLNTAIALGPLLVGFPAFPAIHLRTNSFVLSHATLMRVLDPAGHSKKEALGLESGRHSMTREVQRMGLRAVVVDRAGTVYDPCDWAESETFWQGAQSGLIVADNQSEQYRLGDPDRRRLLARFAWGKAARPA